MPERLQALITVVRGCLRCLENMFDRPDRPAGLAKEKYVHQHRCDPFIGRSTGEPLV